MNAPAQSVTFTIPAFIVALPDLTLLERLILSHLAEHPTACNGKLARLTWLTHRGVEALTRRLRQQGHLQLIKVDGVRHLVVAAAEATHTQCERVVKARFHSSCGDPTSASVQVVPRKVSPAVVAWMNSIAHFLQLRTSVAADWVQRRDFAYARSVLETCIQRVTNEAGLEPEFKISTLAGLQRRANLAFAMEQLVPLLGDISEAEFLSFQATMDTVPGSRLAEFRRRVEAGTVLLAPALEVLALAVAQPGEMVPTQPTGQASPPTPCQPVAPDSDPDDTDSSDDLD